MKNFLHQYTKRTQSPNTQHLSPIQPEPACALLALNVNNLNVYSDKRVAVVLEPITNLLQLFSMKIRTLFLISFLLIGSIQYSLACSPLGNQTSYGTGNIWIGYVYQGMNFNTYKGYANEGTAASPNFDESFGGTQVNYSTNGCPVYTDTFSVRYKLTQTFANGNYTFTLGGDDGFRFSLDGGATWAVNQWVDQGYTTSSYTVGLNGTYNMVFEFYEHFGSNRVSFNEVAACTGSGNPATYGMANIWNGYVYSGMNFNTYKGYVHEGTSVNPNFDESFGGDVVTYNTSDCPITTDNFSVRYRLNINLANATYKFVIGGDDGYRLSLDGGSTYVINKWNDQSYNTTTYSAVLNGSYNMVLDYYENGGQNRISFNLSGGTILPLTLTGFTGQLLSNGEVSLNWETSNEMNTDHFNLQRSGDGISFENLAKVTSQEGNTPSTYSFTDPSPLAGTDFYRLQMVDKDDHYAYSQQIIVSGKKLSQDLRIFPTVLHNSNLFVETGKPIRNAKLELFDLTGKKISEANWETLNGRQTFQPTNVSTLASGAYLVRISSNGEQLLNQIVMMPSR